MDRKFAPILFSLVTVTSVILLISTFAYAANKERAKPVYIAQAEGTAPAPVEAVEEEEVGYSTAFTGFNPVRKYVTGGLMRLFPKLELRGYFWNYTDVLVHKHFNPNFDYRPKKRAPRTLVRSKIDYR